MYFGVLRAVALGGGRRTATNDLPAARKPPKLFEFGTQARRAGRVMYFDPDFSDMRNRPMF